jgi:hypothetical protein
MVWDTKLHTLPTPDYGTGHKLHRLPSLDYGMRALKFTDRHARIMADNE